MNASRITSAISSVVAKRICRLVSSVMRPQLSMIANSPLRLDRAAVPGEIPVDDLRRGRAARRAIGNAITAGAAIGASVDLVTVRALGVVGHDCPFLKS